MFAVHVEVRERNSGVVDDFFFESDASLLHARSDEVGSEGGDVARDGGGIVRHALAQCRRQSTICGIQGTAYQRIGICRKHRTVPVRKHLMIPVSRVVQKDLRVGDAIFGGNGRVVDLWDANVEESISGTDYERARVAEGVCESDAWGEVVGVVGNLAGWGK